MKVNKKDILIYLISVISLLIISYFISFITRDEIWNYGFSYNMSRGMIPYKDFNMVVGPFYNFILSILLSICPNHIFFFSLINSLLFGLFFIPIYHKLKSKTWCFLLFMALLPITFNYNTLISFLLIMILILEESKNKKKDFFIGLLISMMMMTKQNIGILLAGFYLLKKPTNRKKYIFIFLPILLFVFLLTYLNIFLNYIDFCYLGLGNFTSNFKIEWVSLMIELLVVSLLIRRFLKTKDIKIIYLLIFQTMVIPIIDSNHVLISLLPVFYYYLRVLENKEYLLLIKRLLIATVVIMNIRTFPLHYIRIDSFISYRRSGNNLDSYLSNMTSYVNQKEQEHEVFLLIQNAYLIRLQKNQTPSFYDLLNRGNLGKNVSKYLDKIEKTCENKKCLFILDSEYFLKKETETQLDFSFKNYVVKNYNYLETLPSSERIYINY